MPRALLVVPREQLSVSQYRRIRLSLEQQGFQVQVAASRPEEINWTDLRLTPDLSLTTAKGSDYDLVVFVGGRGNKELWNNPAAHQVARDALAAGRVIGASGAAVCILANAGVLQDRRATGPLSIAAALKQRGAKYTPGPVATDDAIVTLRKSEALSPFMQQLLEKVRQRAEVKKAA